MFALVLTLVVHQASDATPWVALTLRQGVAQPAAAAQLEAVRGVLIEAGFSTPTVGDVSNCQRKLPCILQEAKKRGATFVVAVETARIVDEAVVKLDLLMVEEDGRKVESFVVQTTTAAILDTLKTRAQSVLPPAIRRGDAPTAPPSPPVVTAQPETVTVAPPVQRPASPSGFVRWVPALIGVAASGAGVGIFLSAAAERERLETGGLEVDQVRPLVETGKTKEALGVGLMAGGGAAVMASVIWLLAAPNAPATASVVPSQTGAMLVFEGSF